MRATRDGQLWTEAAAVLDYLGQDRAMTFAALATRPI